MGANKVKMSCQARAWVTPEPLSTLHERGLTEDWQDKKESATTAFLARYTRDYPKMPPGLHKLLIKVATYGERNPTRRSRTRAHETVRATIDGCQPQLNDISDKENTIFSGSLSIPKGSGTLKSSCSEAL